MCAGDGEGMFPTDLGGEVVKGGYIVIIGGMVYTPYGVRETIGWLVRNVLGTGKKNPGKTGYIANSCVLNEGVTSRYRLTFIGDILSMHGRKLVISDTLRDFISDSDYLIGNFEGTITEIRSGLRHLGLAQRHTEQVLDAFAGFFPPERTCFSVANNHACDFGEEPFFRSLEILRLRGFRVFGEREQPFLDISNDLRVVTGTMWSNLACPYVSFLKDVSRHIRPGAFNILYPHFGYELELYPRRETISLSKKLLTKFDLVAGHHPHTPQPVTTEKTGGMNRLLAYSLGDFCFGRNIQKYLYGIVLKTEIGKNASGEWRTGRVEWHFTRCAPLAENRKTLIVDTTDKLP